MLLAKSLLDIIFHMIKQAQITIELVFSLHKVYAFKHSTLKSYSNLTCTPSPLPGDPHLCPCWRSCLQPSLKNKVWIDGSLPDKSILHRSNRRLSENRSCARQSSLSGSESISLQDCRRRMCGAGAKNTEEVHCGRGEDVEETQHGKCRAGKSSSAEEK